MFRHVRQYLVVRSQSRGCFAFLVAVAVVGVQHIAVMEIVHVVLGGGNPAVQFLSRGLVAGNQPAFVPPSGDDFPDHRMCRGIGVVYRGHAEFLRGTSRKAIHADEHEQIPLGLVQAVLPVWAIH